MTSDPSPLSGRLRHLGALRFTGPDSLSFLQGQVSNDTRRLGEGQSLLAAYSSPQGRVLAVLHLLPHSSGVLAILPRELAVITSVLLRKFVLRAKVQIEDTDGIIAVAGQYGMRFLDACGIGTPQSSMGYTERDGVGVAAVSHDPGRYWVVGAAESLAAHGLAGDPQQVERIEHDWRLADIRAGLPQIYLPTREAFVAQMLNLDLLDGISFSKGCYTGQEIIARTQHLGRIKRRLYRLGLPHGEWSVGQPIRLTDGRAGRVIDVIRTGGGFEASAVLNVEASSDAAVQGDAPVAAVALTLPYSL